MDDLLRSIDKFIVDDTDGELNLADLSKRILPYGQNRLDRPKRKLNDDEIDAMFDMHNH